MRAPDAAVPARVSTSAPGTQAEATGRAIEEARTHRGGRAAWLQAAAIVAAAAALSLAWRYEASRPFDPQTLAIDVGQLQSQAAEASLLDARFDGMGTLPATFRRMHAQQLADKVAAVTSDLDSRTADDLAADALPEARSDALALHAGLMRVSYGADGGAERPLFESLDERLAALRHGLDPDD